MLCEIAFMFRYSLNLTVDDDGSFLVTCRELPEVTSFGATEDEAVAMGREAVLEAIAARLHDFRDVPLPMGVGPYVAELGTHLSLVLNLFWALQAEGITRAELARRLGWGRTQVDRLFDPNHESKLAKIDEAFAALGRRPSLDPPNRQTAVLAPKGSQSSGLTMSG